jgi:ATP-dependent RNA helicase RhlE
LQAIEKLMGIKITVASGEAPPAGYKPEKKTRGGAPKGQGRKRSGGGQGHRGRRSVAELGSPKKDGKQGAGESQPKAKNKKRASQGKRFKVADPNGGPSRWARGEKRKSKVA